MKKFVLSALICSIFVASNTFANENEFITTENHNVPLSLIEGLQSNSFKGTRGFTNGFVDRTKISFFMNALSLETPTLKLDKGTVGLSAEGYKELFLSNLHFGLGGSFSVFDGNPDSSSFSMKLGTLVEGYGIVEYDVVPNTLLLSLKAGYADVDYNDYNYSSSSFFYGTELEWLVMPLFSIGAVYNKYDIDNGDQHRVGLNLNFYY